MFGLGDRTYSELGQLRTDVGRVSGQVAAIGEFVVQARNGQDDHEKRIRSLERWRYTLPISALASLAAAIVTILKVSGHL